jgi:chemotaxis protein CheD
MPSPRLSGLQVLVVVGIADLVVSNNPSAILTTYSLGSCLGVSVYDPLVKAGGLLHIMLPDSNLDPTKAANRPAMFVDTGMAVLLEEAAKLRIQKNRMIVCVAGGAQFMDATGFFNIGKRNYAALRNVLDQYGLPIHAEAVGGLASRSMYLHLETGEVRLRIAGQTANEILWKNSMPILIG